MGLQAYQKPPSPIPLFNSSADEGKSRYEKPAVFYSARRKRDLQKCKTMPLLILENVIIFHKNVLFMLTCNGFFLFFNELTNKDFDICQFSFLVLKISLAKTHINKTSLGSSIIFKRVKSPKVKKSENHWVKTF